MSSPALANVALRKLFSRPRHSSPPLTSYLDLATAPSPTSTIASSSTTTSSAPTVKVPCIHPSPPENSFFCLLPLLSPKKQKKKKHNCLTRPLITALLRVQRRKSRSRRMHALLQELRSSARMQYYGREVSQLYAWLWLYRLKEVAESWTVF